MYHEKPPGAPSQPSLKATQVQENTSKPRDYRHCLVFNTMTFSECHVAFSCKRRGFFSSCGAWHIVARIEAFQAQGDATHSHTWKNSVSRRWRQFSGDLTLRLACQESRCGPDQRPAGTHPCQSGDGFPEEEVKDAVKISLLIDSLKFPFQQVRGTEESVYSFVSW